jgi:hypothetical protein
MRIQFAAFLLVFLFLNTSKASAPDVVALSHAYFQKHAVAAGLTEQMFVPLNPIEQRVHDEILKRTDQDATNAEVRLLMSHPLAISAVAKVRRVGPDLALQHCQTPGTDWDDNETDSTRHFTSTFALALLAGDSFAYAFTVAHESAMIQSPSQNVGVASSSLMDLHNNYEAILAARAYRQNLSWLQRVSPVTPADAFRQAYIELQNARQLHRLWALRSSGGPCQQPSQMQSYLRYIGVH